MNQRTLTAHLLGAAESEEGTFDEEKMGVRMRLQSRIVSTMIGIALVGMSTSCGRQANCGQEKRKASTQTKPMVGELTVTYEYPNYSLPFAVALGKGLFDEEGVAIKAIKIGTGDKLDINRLDIINGHDFYLLKQGRGVVLAVHPFSRTSDFEKAMLVKRSSAISDWADFKGKGVVVADAGTDMPMLNQAFADHGLKTLGAEERDVTLWGGGGAVAGFASDKDVHALYGWSATVLPLMRQHPNDFKILWRDLGKKEGSESPLVACSYVKVSILPNKKEAVAAYVRAVNRAIDFIREDPKAAARLLPKHFDVDKKWAVNMEIYDFHKSTDVVDFSALSTKLGVDVAAHLLDFQQE